ncbi:MAG TPA: polyamine ABC transporter substrate-binding protein [Steroidobacteraceae bacterium]|nr:polyamine ABC transporter substrate-binding protein [Steroidobacteraceae bacterium]
MSTRSLSALVSASCLFLLIACGKKEEAPPPQAEAAPPAAVFDTDAEKVVNVYNWSDYIEPKVLEEFETETGVHVNYEVMDSNALLETKLRAGRSGYDVVVPSASYLARQIKSNIYQKLDKSKLDNLKNLDADITKRLEVFDPGNEHAVNYMWGTSGVAYNEGLIKAAMPDAPVDSFAMFWDPKVVSKFAKCGVSILDEPGEVLGTVLMYLGKDPNSESPEDLKAAEKVLLSVRPYVRLINSSKYIEDLANGEICLALGWSGDTLQAKSRADEAGKGLTIKYNIPKEGAVMFFDNMAIPADAVHVKNAHLFINYMLRADVAAKNSNFISFANSNAASWPLVSAEVKSNPGIFPTPEMMPKLVPDLPESAEFTKQLTRTWTRFRTGK